MKRRGFLGLLGGAAVAGPGMVKQAVSSAPVGVDAMSLSSLIPDDYDTPYAGSTATVQDGTYDYGKWLEDRIAEIVGISEEERRRRLSSIHPSMLDPDLAVNRSMSLSFKIGEQKRRILQRSLDAEHFDLKRELEKHLKNSLS